MKLRNISILVYLLLAITPLVAGLGYALLYSLGLFGALSTGFTLDHWVAALTSAYVWQSLALSAGIALVGMVISVGLGLFVSIVLKPQFEKGWSFILYWPLTIPPLIAAFWVFQFLGTTGWLARLLGFGSPGQFPALVNDYWHVGVVVASVMLTFPFITLLLLVQARAANMDMLTGMAKTLGASSWQSTWKVAVPVLLHRTRPTLILYGLFLMGAYEVPLLLGRQSPRMLSVLIAHKFRKFDLLELPQAYVLTCLYALVVVLVVRRV